MIEKFSVKMEQKPYKLVGFNVMTVSEKLNLTQCTRAGCRVLRTCHGQQKPSFCLTSLRFPLVDKDRVNVEAGLHLDSSISKLCNEIWEAADFTEQRFTRLVALEPRGPGVMVSSRWQWLGYTKLRAHV